MSDPTLIADLVRAGVDAELVARVAAAIVVRDSPGHVRDIVRAYETGRKRKQRETTDKPSGKQTMSAPVSASENSQNVRDNDGRDTNLLSSSTDSQRSKEEKSSRRGSRLQVGAPIPVEYTEWAFGEGLTIDRITQIWTEFVDYWGAVPGARGLKTDWFATFRNRVRQVKEGPNGHRGPRPLQDDSKSASRAAARLAEAAKRGEFSFGPRPSLLPDPSEPVVRLLSKG